MMDWKTKAGKRVFHATFAAEAQAAGDTIGTALYFRAYWCDVLYGHAEWVDVTEFGEDHMQIKLYTDCKSLFDHLKKDGAVPDDKWVAVAVASLKCCASAGAGRNEEKAECKWIASRWQLADCLTRPNVTYTLRTILNRGATSLHELSAQQIKRDKQAKKSKTQKPASAINFIQWDGQRN